MEYANDEIFNIRYNKYKDRLEIRNKGKFKKFIKQHKFMSSAIAITLISIGIDCVLIYEFCSILCTL